MLAPLAQRKKNRSLRFGGDIVNFAHPSIPYNNSILLFGIAGREQTNFCSLGKGLAKPEHFTETG